MCNTTGFVVTRVLIPAWIIAYYLKYHAMVRPWREAGTGDCRAAMDAEGKAWKRLSCRERGW